MIPEKRIPVNKLFLKELIIEIQQIIEVVRLHGSKFRQAHRRKLSHILLGSITAEPVATMDTARINDLIFVITEREMVTKI